jgi:hypothetical protein
MAGTQLVYVDMVRKNCTPHDAGNPERIYREACKHELGKWGPYRWVFLFVGQGCRGATVRNLWYVATGCEESGTLAASRAESADNCIERPFLEEKADRRRGSRRVTLDLSVLIQELFASQQRSGTFVQTFHGHVGRRNQGSRRR